MDTVLNLKPKDFGKLLTNIDALNLNELNDLIARYVEQGLTSSMLPPMPSDHRRERGQLTSLIPPAGRHIPALSNAAIESLLTAEDVLHLEPTHPTND